MKEISKLFICMLLLLMTMSSTCTLAASSQQSTSKPVYYVNWVEGSNGNYQDEFRIFKNAGGNRIKVSSKMAYQLVVANKLIYFMQMDSLEGNDGWPQLGTIWQMDKDGKNEKTVLPGVTIYTLAYDGTYIYFCSEGKYDNTIMRIKPGGKPEVFLKDARTLRMQYSNGWLYFVDNYTHAPTGIKRANVSTKKVEKVTDKSPEFNYGFPFGVTDDYLLVPTGGQYDDETSVYTNVDVYKINLSTKKEEVFKDFTYTGTSYNFKDLQNGILVNYSYTDNKMGFVDLNSAQADQLQVLSLTGSYQYDNQVGVTYALQNTTDKVATLRYALVVWTKNVAEVHFLRGSNVSPGDVYYGHYYSQLVNGGLNVDGVEAILVKFNDDKDMQSFERGIPWDTSVDYSGIGDIYSVAKTTAGKKWFKDAFNMTVDFVN